ncbi:hypothetical protein DUI87_11431 [Hirundo rustica rustica]|uniref:Uncharacterized protein n=1 Tax=Hirundo rustica rustica TaxID=333673 RepID=A0A3M0KDV3_HIRRU|nr:hypothetical protein DUI87_11431 [Hirundo rustica rustica]
MQVGEQPVPTITAELLEREVESSTVKSVNWRILNTGENTVGIKQELPDGLDLCSCAEPPAEAVGHAGQCWTVLDNAGQCWTHWTMLDSAGQCWTMLENAGQCWTMLDTLDNAGQCWTRWTMLDTLDNAGQCWTVLDTLDNAGQCWTMLDTLDNAGQCWTVLDTLDNAGHTGHRAMTLS